MTFNHVLANRVIDYSPALRKKVKHFFDQLPNEISPFRLDIELLNEKLISEEELLKIVASVWNIPLYDENQHALDGEMLKRFSMDFIVQNQILPLAFRNGKYWVAVTDWFNLLCHQKLVGLLDGPFQPVLMTKKVWEGICQMFFSHRETHSLLNNIEQNGENLVSETTQENQEIDSAPIVQLVDAIIKEAISLGASDIHFEPMERNVRVRMRIDGILVEKASLNHKTYSSLLTRIKIASNIDITKKRIPQDGRMKYLSENQEYDCRVSTLPISDGEKIVIRILDHRRLGLKFREIGISEHDQKLIAKLLAAPYGMILVTGPTGCGKTTTLYSFIQELNKSECNIVTVEDPIEYRMEGINQLQVNPAIDVTFAKALRSILRQDPDIIMIGEIRDEETAQMATRAAITGHLILATLHTNHASSAVTRLLDMKIEPYLTAEALIGVVSQRLIRKLCPYCKTSYRPSSWEKAKIDREVERLFRANGCLKCQMTGYEGRVAVMEIMMIDEEIRRLIRNQASIELVNSLAVKKGMRTLREGCMDLLLAGQTTVYELIRLGII
ncbi:MAG TPA: GspE/PulE family protein [Bacilli bacterium]|nr:GspE/PulE family protein [Bacilli bacterium]